MVSNPININLGVIGTGAVFRLMHLPAIIRLNNKFRITKIYDISKEALKTANNLAEKFGVKFYVAKNPDEIFLDKEIEAVAILSPTSSHFQYTITALKNNKHIFLEKPVAIKTGELIQMKNLAQKKKRYVQVGMVLRYSSFFKKLMGIIESRYLGKLLWMQWIETRPFDPMIWRYQKINGDAIIHDKAIHQINLFNAVSGSKAKRVLAMAGQYMLNKYKYRNLRTFNREVKLKGDSNDHLMAIIEYRNGVKADLVISYVSPHSRESRWVLQFEKGRLIVHPQTYIKEQKGNKKRWLNHPSVIYLYKDDLTFNPPWKIPMSYPPSEDNLIFYDENLQDPLHPGSVEQWEEFYNSIVNNVKPECNLDLAIEDMNVVEAIYKSSRKNLI